MGPYSTQNLCIASAKAGVLGLISTVGMAGGLVTPKEGSEKVFGIGTPKVLLRKSLSDLL